MSRAAPGGSGTALAEVGPGAGPAPRAARFAARGVAGRLRAGWAAVVAWLMAIAAVAVVAWQAGAGFDPTDEASYLQAVAVPERGDAFNGFFGLYLRPLWALAGWDVARVRLLGLAGLVAVAVLLGLAVARLSGLPRATLLPMSVAASTGYYATTWRIPSYNWLALVGAALVCTGLLRLLAGDRARWGLACGSGVAVAAAGKLPSGAILVLLGVLVVGVGVAAERRRPALLWSGAALAVAVAVHLVAVLPPAQTVRLVRRSAAMLAVVSPGSYSPAGAVVALVSGSAHALLAAVVGGGVVGLLPLALAPRGPRRSVWFRPLCLAVAAVSATLALVAGAWVGGTSHPDRVAGLLPVLVALGTASALATRLGLSTGAPRSWTAGAAVLVGGVAACVFGSNVLLSWQLTTMTLLLAPACVLACGALDRAAPVPGGGPARGPGIAGVLVLVICAGSLVTAVQAHEDPRMSAPLAEATSPVALGRVTVGTDPETARQVGDLESAARAAGWTPGTPLVDTTFTPLLPLALGARVPPVLIPGFPGYDLATVCQAVRGLGPQWRDAWLVVLPGSSDRQRAQLAAYLGRRYPDDYAPVATLSPRGADFAGLLLRPVTPGPAAGPGAAAPGSCLDRP